MKKNQLNRLEFLKNRLVRFWFYKLETEKTEPNPNRKKLSQTNKIEKTKKKTQAKREKIKPNLKNQFEPVFVLK